MASSWFLGNLIYSSLSPTKSEAEWSFTLSPWSRYEHLTCTVVPCTSETQSFHGDGPIRTPNVLHVRDKQHHGRGLLDNFVGLWVQSSDYLFWRMKFNGSSFKIFSKTWGQDNICTFNDGIEFIKLLLRRLRLQRCQFLEHIPLSVDAVTSKRNGLMTTCTWIDVGIILRLSGALIASSISCNALAGSFLT